MLTTSLLLFLHLIAVTFWVGGMAVMHVAVRPAAVATLEPPQRLPFMAAALSRFFVGVSIAVATVLVSGLGLVMAAGGFARVHWSVHGMFTVGLVMMVLFLHIRFAPYARLQRAVAAREWPVAAVQLGNIRKLVAVNLMLGVGVVALAVVGRAF
ncbi:CopD family protein [Variovorax arabinosiphilus]|uniref:CopD family protein n=1 Tax=Variovorax arabinosiphilus TaxID=3053498 RepID=UPI002575D7BF|nr:MULTISPECIES: CopD family protein [unclassified Variovorax]MDM0121427.1 CopD family protein [Variovorax sp. J2L1-78]MDM0130488.1 CopD family protein [Variovorax sp. J2L1-63]MDM0234190.1 CopD family protein [Variovorax sp. J2R1-6]